MKLMILTNNYIKSQEILVIEFIISSRTMF